jgi:hypothetical protein
MSIPSVLDADKNDDCSCFVVVTVQRHFKGGHLIAPTLEK